MAMSWISRNQYRGVFASLLIAVFFSSQAFSCCMVNHRLGQFIISSWTKHAGMAATHSCCPPAKTSAGNQDASKPGPMPSGCCIQDSNQNFPQMVSEHVPVPDMTGLVVALLPMVSLDAPGFPVPQCLQTGASPPVYLTTLRLLI
ncbi:MAG: hypothetical protein JWO30_526 [Fibrobacteres bacterium]|nr:hypothetical protein [Fibrobacterota bacterium]